MKLITAVASSFPLLTKFTTTKGLIHLGLNLED